MSTTDRVDAIRARLAAAWDKQPWTVQEGHDPGCYRVPEIGMCGEDEVSLADATLIANAPADLAWLLEENARLTAQVDRARS